MDGSRFDQFARSLARTGSRRSYLKAALAATASALFARPVSAQEDDCGVICASSDDCANSLGGCFDCCGVCTSYSSDSSNCGGCGIVCPAGSTCSSGGCICDASLSDCGGFCADLGSDPVNCGACGFTCAGNETCCNGVCSDLMLDRSTCGSCDRACQADYRCCEGGCYDWYNDPSNCGECGVVCEAGQVCQNAYCVGGCDAGLTACGNICSDLTSDEANCGACDVVCDSSTTCRNGKCIRPQCPGENETRCVDGCFDLSSHPTHCGGCNNFCIFAKSLCCGAVCFDGDTDPNNCGACGNVCGPDLVCDAGICKATALKDYRQVKHFTPTPDMCVAKPRSERSLTELAGHPRRARLDTFADWQQALRELQADAVPATPEAAQAMADAFVGYLACGNAGDFARKSATLSDRLTTDLLIDSRIASEQIPNLLANPIQEQSARSWLEIASAGPSFQTELGGWTNYNVHDPGITTLELLVYTITDSDGSTIIDRLVSLTPPSESGTVAVRSYLCSESDTPGEYHPDSCQASSASVALAITGLDQQLISRVARSTSGTGIVRLDDIPTGDAELHVNPGHAVAPAGQVISVHLEAGIRVEALLAGAGEPASGPGRYASTSNVLKLSPDSPYTSFNLYQVITKERYEIGDNDPVFDFCREVKCDTHNCQMCDSASQSCIEACSSCEHCAYDSDADTFYCRPTVGFCDSSEVCQSSGTCCSPHGVACDSTSSCCAASDLCQDGYCCVDQGNACAIDSDCCGDPSITACIDGSCRNCVPFSAECDGNTLCCSGVCDDGMCQLVA
ncbi:hypothetical protein BH09CHL1_BH09CHL1_35720 [soil metagenome]